MASSALKRIIPLFDRVLVERFAAEKVTKGGIHVPDKALGKVLNATVVAVGKGLKQKDGTHVPVSVQAGDKVLLPEYGGTKNSNQFWCNLCQRKFCSSSALYQHGKRLSHLKRAMKMSSARCTTITNGKITSCVQKSKPLSIPISMTRVPSPPPAVPQTESITKDQIIIRKHRHDQDNSISYTCNLCGCRCWSIRNIRRHIRLHADVRPYTCNICQLKFKSYSNLMKHLKTNRHQQNKDTNEKNWTIDTQALEEQNKLINQVLIIDEDNQIVECQSSTELSSSIDESNNLLEDLHIPDSRLIDGDAAELALIDPNTFEELHKAAECLLNLQGAFYFGEDENGTDKTNPLLSN
ncbi:unnamed protein product [Rotaria sp. Silwood1]|nr:unnamed protein product [Rotaria sp. Silwood1]CAF1003964.1 unnamed protein product [Rotaria sp. Silwood1]CAF3397218.1 unnamed protein product [Rotaria sp. Silwood1]CAF3421363.1 unnamed protein product [Rotaria sp. Silwood1]CAF3423394.1 unnamed protein product [Rotaria sp. Silwood1]